MGRVDCLAVSKSIAVLFVGLALAGCKTTGEAEFNASAFSADGTPSRGEAMPQGKRANILPAGFAAFCARSPEHCSAPPESAEVASVAANWTEIDRINRGVNDAVQSESDEKHFGRSEYWTIVSDGRGDCEDFALTKKQLLLAAGIPARSLRLAVATTLRGERHSVLTVATDRGDFVLDNLTNDILAWNQTGYAWVSRQDGHSAMGWVMFNDSSENLHTASN